MPSGESISNGRLRSVTRAIGALLALICAAFVANPAMAANPLISFTTVAAESGTLEFRWTGDNGYAVTESAKISVS